MLENIKIKFLKLINPLSIPRETLPQLLEALKGFETTLTIGDDILIQNIYCRQEVEYKEFYSMLTRLVKVLPAVYSSLYMFTYAEWFVSMENNGITVETQLVVLHRKNGPAVITVDKDVNLKVKNPTIYSLKAIESIEDIHKEFALTTPEET
jgi:hypothetical protein